MIVATAYLFLGACSSSMTLSEYAGEVERLVTTMNQRIDDGEEELGANSTLARARTYFADRVDARNEFLKAFAALDPPDEVLDLHEAAFDIVTRLSKAEATLADLVDNAESFEAASAIWTTPEGVAFQALDDEALAICAAAQANIDATAERDVFSDVPWIPPAMKDVVEVTFRCNRAQR